MTDNKYTQREWDRTVGYGKVPDEYRIEKKSAVSNWKNTYAELQKIKEDIKNEYLYVRLQSHTCRTYALRQARC